jgi:hypothetical protein
MLHLFTGLILDLAAAIFIIATQPQLPHQPGQGGVANFYAVLFGENLMHPLYPALAFRKKMGEKIMIDLDLIIAYFWGHFSFL